MASNTNNDHPNKPIANPLNPFAAGSSVVAGKTPSAEEFANLQNYIDEVGYAKETTNQKFLRKFKEEPWVPIGCGVTASCLFFGSRTIWMKNAGAKAQFWMKARVISQGLTVAAIMAGLTWKAQKRMSGEVPPAPSSSS